MKKMFLKISQNSQELCEIFKNTFFYRTPPVAASDLRKVFSRTAVHDSFLHAEQKQFFNRKGWIFNQPKILFYKLAFQVKQIFVAHSLRNAEGARYKINFRGRGNFSHFDGSFWENFQNSPLLQNTFRRLPLPR